MSLPVRITSAARHDLIEIATLIGRGDRRAADRFLEAADTTVSLIADFPSMGRVVKKSKVVQRSAIRVLAVTNFRNYLIFYAAHPDETILLRVLDGRRDLAALV